MKTATVRARIEPQLKLEVKGVLEDLGLSFSEAIELFLKQIKLHNGIPFEIRVPNKVTLKTFADTDQSKNLRHHKKAEDMFKELGISKHPEETDEKS